MDQSIGQNATTNLPEDDTMDTSDETNTTPFGLLDLPPELWTTICNLALIPEREIHLNLNSPQSEYHFQLRQPALTRTCKTIRHQTLPHFYQTTTIRISAEGERKRTPDFARVHEWLAAIGRANSDNIRHLFYSAWGFNRDDAARRVPDIRPLKVVRRVSVGFANVNGRKRVLMPARVVFLLAMEGMEGVVDAAWEEEARAVEENRRRRFAEGEKGSVTSMVRGGLGRERLVPAMMR